MIIHLKEEELGFSGETDASLERLDELVDGHRAVCAEDLAVVFPVSQHRDGKTIALVSFRLLDVLIFRRCTIITTFTVIIIVIIGSTGSEL